MIFETCRSQSDIPVLMLTANDLEMNEVIGFELGANDYVTKPFHLPFARENSESSANDRKRGQKCL